MTRNVTDLRRLMWLLFTPLYAGFPSSIREDLSLWSLSRMIGEMEYENSCYDDILFRVIFELSSHDLCRIASAACT